jgi:Flp pilus assembly secretin CpaC
MAAGLTAAVALSSLGAAALADGVDGATAPRPAPQPTAQPVGDIRLMIDTAEPLRLPAAAGGVVVANPSIAGVSVQNDRLLFVTGRAYGATSLTVVDTEGRTMYHGIITVLPSEDQSVMVTRGVATSRFLCTPVCRPQPDIGDDPAGFGTAIGQAGARAGAARGG